MFMGPFTDGGDWSETGIKGIDRFVQRVWRTFSILEPAHRRSKSEGGNTKSEQTSKLLSAMHLTIKRMTESIDRFQFNTAISALMEFLNQAEGSPELTADIAKMFVILLAPLAPHLAEELWSTLGGKDFVINQQWPTYEPKFLVSDTMTIVVQVNGKLRASMELPADMPEKEIVRLAKAHENVAKFLEGNKPKKEIYVKGKLVSLVI
jgi:leucyl-tRNA synthetase